MLPQKEVFGLSDLDLVVLGPDKHVLVLGSDKRVLVLGPDKHALVALVLGDPKTSGLAIVVLYGLDFEVADLDLQEPDLKILDLEVVDRRAPDQADKDELVYSLQSTGLNWGHRVHLQGQDHIDHL